MTKYIYIMNIHRAPGGHVIHPLPSTR